MLKIPNPVAYTCTNCGEPAVVAEFATGMHPVHCGTYRERCAARPGPPGPDATVSAPPRSLASGPRSRRSWLRRTARV